MKIREVPYGATISLEGESFAHLLPTIALSLYPALLLGEVPLGYHFFHHVNVLGRDVLLAIPGEVEVEAVCPPI